ncbi:unnamed protein product [marine sediment metagenome]|jgi:hypothetical protein|uniref:Uncharacterized protein n=1 Tax=marine sediment metagenome TaxID=412755 RepID=X1IWA9_9ZZZZ
MIRKYFYIPPTGISVNHAGYHLAVINVYLQYRPVNKYMKFDCLPILEKTKQKIGTSYFKHISLEGDCYIAFLVFSNSGAGFWMSRPWDLTERTRGKQRHQD